MRIIVLDERLEVSERAKRVLDPLGVRVCFGGSIAELDLILARSWPTDLLLVNLGGELTGWELAAELRRICFAGKTLSLVDDLTQADVAHLSQLARSECLLRPASASLLDDLLLRAVTDAIRPGCEPPPERPRAALTDHQAFDGIVGRSKPMQDVFWRIEKVASSDANVCIYGESGTGKELIARALHERSGRRDQPFIALDCTTIPEGLMESHLFGHVKGSFTGAIDHREGVFSLAHKGTLFMDELCELSLPLQAKLLRVVQTREFVKVGGTKPVRTDIRLVTATNKDPKQEVDRGNFREDLYYRLAVVMIKLPPLRERRDDIPLLVEHFVKKFAAAYARPIRAISPAAMNRLVTAPWPGNVRQLENFLEQAVVLADGEILTERDFFPGDPVPEEPVNSCLLTLEQGLPLREVERRYILRTLQVCQGNRSEAARRLGISIRGLQYKLKSYSIDRPGYLRPPSSAANSILTGGSSR